MNSKHNIIYVFPIVVLSCYVVADTVNLTPVNDNTLYESNTGSISNGKGSYLFVGRTGQGIGASIRRALIRFDVADNVPEGSTITSVTLSLTLSKSAAGSGTQVLTLHRLSQDWGEGSSNDFGNEGSGTTAQTNDATWRHRFFSNQLWNIPGGDFNSAASGSAEVQTFFITYTFASTSGMIADVQDWLDNDSTNFGWLIKSSETANRTAKRFNSRENTSNPPRLTIEFTPPLTEPEITVEGSGFTINDGDASPRDDDGTDFGTPIQHDTPPSRQFVIRNDGTADLVVTAITLPSGFNLIGGPSFSATIPASQQQTFTIELETSAIGLFSGDVVISSNDADEGSFNFAISGDVTPLEIEPLKDTTIYEPNPDVKSNGGGSSLFIGRTGTNAAEKLRRALIAFGIAESIPAGSIINSISLQMFLTMIPQDAAPGETQTIDLHRLLADWGEENSVGGGAGADPEIGDATWTHSFHETLAWATPGGDFTTPESGSMSVGDQVNMYYTAGSTSEMISDAAGWLDNPSTNFGWILLNHTESNSQTARQFNTRENSSDRPLLKIDFTPPITPQPEIEVTGGGMVIRGQSTVPSFDDDTDFGSVERVSEGPLHTFTVKNWGEGNLILGSVTVPSGFSIVSDLNTTLAEGQSVDFQVRLESGAIGTKSGDVSFDTNDGTNGEDPFVFAITGEVLEIPPEITVTGNGEAIVAGATVISSTNGTDFGLEILDDPAPTQTFVIRNDGDATLTVTGITISNGFSLLVPAPGDFPIDINSGQHIEFTIQLDTSAAGKQSGVVEIISNDDDEDRFTFTIAGKVLEPLTTLDVDGNGRVDALTDGIIVLRHMFGIAGLALVNNALAADAVRVDPEEIRILLEALEQ